MILDAVAMEEEYNRDLLPAASSASTPTTSTST